MSIVELCNPCRPSHRGNPTLNHVEMEMEMFYLMTHSRKFYLWLYGIRHMVKDHSDSQKGNPLLPHRLELEVAQWVHPMKDRSDDPSHHERTLLAQLNHNIQ